MIFPRVAVASLFIASLFVGACGGKQNPPPNETTPVEIPPVPSAAPSSAVDPAQKPDVQVAAQVSLDDAGAMDPSNNALDGDSPGIGKEAPELALKATSRARVPTMRSLRGKIVVVHFFATWCEPCKKAMPALQSLMKGDVVVVGVSVDDTQQDVAPFVRQLKVTFPTGWDDGKKTTAKYQPRSMPTTYLIDRAGMIRYVQSGYHDGDASSLATEIAKLK